MKMATLQQGVCSWWQSWYLLWHGSANGCHIGFMQNRHTTFVSGLPDLAMLDEDYKKRSVPPVWQVMDFIFSYQPKNHKQWHTIGSCMFGSEPTVDVHFCRSFGVWSGRVVVGSWSTVCWSQSTDTRSRLQTTTSSCYGTVETWRMTAGWVITSRSSTTSIRLSTLIHTLKSPRRTCQHDVSATQFQQLLNVTHFALPHFNQLIQITFYWITTVS